MTLGQVACDPEDYKTFRRRGPGWCPPYQILWLSPSPVNAGSVDRPCRSSMDPKTLPSGGSAVR